MPWIELGLPIDERQALVIRMYHNGLSRNIVAPIGKSPNDSIKLFFISGVVKFGATQRHTKVSQRSFGLDEDRPNANAASITFNFK